MRTAIFAQVVDPMQPSGEIRFGTVPHPWTSAPSSRDGTRRSTLIRSTSVCTSFAPGTRAMMTRRSSSFRVSVVVPHDASDGATYAQERDVFIVDLPAHGESEKPSSPLSLAEYAAVTAAWLDGLELERAVLIGHSSIPRSWSSSRSAVRGPWMRLYSSARLSTRKHERWGVSWLAFCSTPSGTM